MANERYFKTYQRDVRIFTAEETFEKGQVFTRAPLETGRSRLLVNFDLVNEGEAVTNRRGVRPVMVGLPFNVSGLEPKLLNNLSITQGYDAVEEDNERYRLIVANQFSPEDAAVPNSNLYKAPAELWVIDADRGDTEYPCLEEYDVSCRNLYAIPLSYELPEDPEGFVAPKSYYHVPKNPQTHGISLAHKEYLGRPVGTFAWGNDYYSFNTDGDLIRAIYQPDDPDAEITATFLTEKMTPKEITAAEAAHFGFNMLSDTPYEFHDSIEQGVIQFQGFWAYSGSRVVTEPLLNTPYKFRCFYTAESGQTYKFVWQYRERDTNDWTKLKEAEYTISAEDPPEISVEAFSSPFENLVLRISAYKKEGDTYGTDPEKYIDMGIFFAKAPSSLLANRELKDYDLSKVSGMTYWRGRLWLYGLAQDPSILFASDINEPTYFPYPNNIDIFDEPIISVVPFNENLLVFTRSTLNQINLDSEGSWTKKVLQANLDFEDFDARFIQVVKNMVFFKSGDYYYMIVPKTLSLQQELAVAPVSKNIEYFLDDFETNSKILIETLYDYEGTLELVNHYNFLNYEDVHNVYVFRTDSGLFINLVLLYNTVDRTWRTYVYETQAMYYPLKQDATKPSTLIAPAYVKFNINSQETDVVGVQFLEAARVSVSDFYIPRHSTFRYATNSWQPDDGVIMTAFSSLHKYYNYQMLDSGYRDQVLDHNKRYRELQLKFNNVGATTLRFQTEFILDGATRISRFKYETEHIVDPTDPNFGLIYISRTPVENLEVPGATMLAESHDETNTWQLDVSRFPEVAYWKARLKVSGKGYTPRFRLIGRSEERYEILGYTWIYRQMYLR